MKRMIVATEDDIPPSDVILNEVADWASNHRIRGFRKFEKYGMYFEKHSIQSLINDRIRYFNENVREYGDGFATDWDEDDWMTILYKDGKIRQINPDCDEGNRRISTDNIDSIIVDGSWGTAFAGPHIGFRDETTYPDIPDIRVDFDI